MEHTIEVKSVTVLVNLSQWLLDNLHLDFRQYVDSMLYHSDGPSFKSEDINIPTQSVGAVGPMFKSISLVIKLGHFDFSKTGGRIGHTLHLVYNYEHPNGSNGKTVGFISYDNCKTFEPYN